MVDSLSDCESGRVVECAVREIRLAVECCRGARRDDGGDDAGGEDEVECQVVEGEAPTALPKKGKTSASQLAQKTLEDFLLGKKK